MSYCDCGHDMPTVHHASMRTAREQHQCGECGVGIMPGERYEHVWGVWDGIPETQKTCARCLDLRDWVTAHVPCVCWQYGNMRDDVMSAIDDYSPSETPGLRFGALRREVAIRRHCDGGNED